jgi:hypothetical protein
MKSKNLDGFLNIPFGTSKEVLIELIKEYEGVIDEGTNDSETLIISNMIFDGDQTQLILFKFFENKFWKAIVYFDCPKKKLIEAYHTIKEVINEKYYFTESSQDFYSSSLLKFLNLDQIAIKRGKAQFFTSWNFDNSPYKDNGIILEINKEFDLKLTYLSESIEGEYFKTKNKDF